MKLLAIFLISLSTWAAAVPVLYSDDCAGDVDCAVSASTINKLADTGVINLVAMTADSANDQAAPSLFIFERYYNRASLNIGAYQGSISCSNSCSNSSWTAGLVTQYNAGDTRANYEDCTTTWRRAVAGNPGIVLIMSGYAPCVTAFLASGADSVSPLTGQQLAKANVAKLVILGGVNPSGSEFNFQSTPQEWHDLFILWTSQNGYPPIWMVDFNDGNITNAGPSHFTVDTINPMLYAYDIAGFGTTRPVWDSLTILLGAYGLSLGSTTMFADAGNGTQSVDATTGANSWSTGTASGQHYVTNVASAAFFAGLLDGVTHPFGYPVLPIGANIGTAVFNDISINGGTLFQ